MDVKKQPPEITTFIINQLNLPPTTEEISMKTMYDVFSMEVPIQPDIVLKDQGILYFIEVKKSAVTIDTIARMQLLKELWLKWRTDDNRINPENAIVLIIAAKWFYPREEKIANQLQIRLIKLPLNISISGNEEYSTTGMKITTDKSWRIVSRLLKEKNTSIRQLSLKEDVSYGWAHKVIGMLISQDVVKKDYNYVHISDMKKLLNVVAWERPIKNLQFNEEIYIQSPNAFSAAKQISFLLKEQKTSFAFTSYTSGGLYTGYAIRQDAVYLYLEKDQIPHFKEQFEVNPKTGIRVNIYIPDRDVFANSREIENVIVTSPSQTLLDLAGLGYSAMDLTKMMVEKYDNL
ncbi:MAG: hypothetical protein Q7U51_14100 [Methanoregula sp.]|nr:hypothetical protein [Methanoregula sp.]